MAKKKTKEDGFAVGSGWTNWDLNSVCGYYTGNIFTSSGIIILYYQSKSKTGVSYATARIAHKGRIYDLHTSDKVTRLGWVRIVKKWARSVYERSLKYESRR